MPIAYADTMSIEIIKDCLNLLIFPAILNNIGYYLIKQVFFVIRAHSFLEQGH